jgi:hypothetical protein
VGADVFGGDHVQVSLGGRVLWLRRRTGENVYFLQLGASVSPRFREGS